MSRPPLYLFSPLPPARNGIADYTDTLMGALEVHYRCIGVVADDAPTPDWPEALHISEYRRIAAGVAAERHLFQLGNNAGHAYLIPWLERVPGVLTVHDATMAHVLDWITAHGGGGGPAYRRLAEVSHGRDGLAMLEQAAAGGLWFGAMGQELGFLSPLVQPARAVVVHSHLARQRVLAAAPRVPVHVIAHFAKPMSDLGRVAGDGALRILCLGFPARAKRLDLVLAALAILRTEGVPARLTIAGEVRPEEVDIEAEIAALGLEPLVEITGYVGEEHMADLLDSADVVVNLRDPTSGESSGTLARAMAAGVCAVVSDIGTYAEFPDGTVVKLRKAMMNAQALAQTLWRLHADPAHREATGQRGRKHVLESCGLVQVADAYRDAIEAAYACPPPAVRAEAAVSHFPPTRQAALEELARDTGALDYPYQLWWRERLLPVPQADDVLCLLGVEAPLATMIAREWRWRTKEAAGAETGPVAAALVLVDEADANTMAERVRTAGVLAQHLPSGGSLTIEVANESYLHETVTRTFERCGLRMLREAHGPVLPLMGVSFERWLPSNWAATYVRCAASLEAA